MRTEEEIRRMYSNLKKAQGKWAKIDSTTQIKLDENSLIIKTLEWVLEEKKELFGIDSVF